MKYQKASIKMLMSKNCNNHTEPWIKEKDGYIVEIDGTQVGLTKTDYNLWTATFIENGMAVYTIDDYKTRKSLVEFLTNMMKKVEPYDSKIRESAREIFNKALERYEGENE